MPTSPGEKAAAHLEMARQSCRVYFRLSEVETDFNWALTILFYAAMHLVQAYAHQVHAEKPTAFPPVKHEERERFMALHLPTLLSPYKRPLDASMQCRYHLYKPGYEELQRYYDRCFVPIREGLAARGVSLDPPAAARV